MDRAAATAAAADPAPGSPTGFHDIIRVCHVLLRGGYGHKDTSMTC